STALETHSVAKDSIDVVLGEDVRDYVIANEYATLFPYDETGLPADLSAHAHRRLWRIRRRLETQLDFQQTKEQRGLRWFDHSMFFPKRFQNRFGIAFAFVSTHNHFVLDRGGKVFKQSAPVIKLPEGSSEDDHLALL